MAKFGMFSGIVPCVARLLINRLWFKRNRRDVGFLNKTCRLIENEPTTSLMVMSSKSKDTLTCSDSLRRGKKSFL